ncbi:E3 ubiquitin-protein ligase DDB_G0292642-like [Argopecten irradians]|uniref:E3 ubiquitin-protein ligase DDB_G0292642-like n=1 Tax=Argopecten irradians TaxID=31199 RepID=UPI00371B6E29
MDQELFVRSSQLFQSHSEIKVDEIEVIKDTKILKDDETEFRTDDITEIMIIRKDRRMPIGERAPEEDMFEGDMADGDRIRMSCGHTATPENLYRYCFTKLNSCDLSFKCMECDEVWEFPEISKKADMTDDESVFFSRKMTKVSIDYNNDIRQCPTCGIHCTRLSPDNKQVECVYCMRDGKSVYAFCWECVVPWDPGHNCEKDNINISQRTLDNCERVKMQFSNIPNVPKVRACPECKTLIEHDGGCKTMDCPNPTCKHTFCFSCLKPKNKFGGLQCGSYNSKCTVAPVQKLVI